MFQILKSLIVIKYFEIFWLKTNKALEHLFILLLYCANKYGFRFMQPNFPTSILSLLMEFSANAQPQNFHAEYSSRVTFYSSEI